MNNGVSCDDFGDKLFLIATPDQEQPFIVMLDRFLRYILYCLCLLLTHPCGTWTPYTFVFRFGIPFVLKVTRRTVSTEADALRFLNHVKPHLPIPRLVIAFEYNESTYTIMTKLPGRNIHTRSVVDDPPARLHEKLGGPYASTLKCYRNMMNEGLASLPAQTRDALAADPVVWVHTDLRMHNMLVGEYWR